MSVEWSYHFFYKREHKIETHNMSVIFNEKHNMIPIVLESHSGQNLCFCILLQTSQVVCDLM